MHAVPLIFGFLAHFTIFLQSLFLASTFLHFLCIFRFFARILLRSVVYAGSNHRLGLAGEFGQICAGIYQCAIQRGSAGMELGKVLEPQLDLTNSVRLKSDSSALPCHPCTILRATTYMPRIRHVVIINFLKVEIPRPKLNDISIYQGCKPSPSPQKSIKEWCRTQSCFIEFEPCEKAMK